MDKRNFVTCSLQSEEDEQLPERDCPLVRAIKKNCTTEPAIHLLWWSPLRDVSLPNVAKMLGALHSSGGYPLSPVISVQSPVSIQCLVGKVNILFLRLSPLRSNFICLMDDLSRQASAMTLNTSYPIWYRKLAGQDAFRLYRSSMICSKSCCICCPA